jgi:hypothetical protein
MFFMSGSPDSARVEAARYGFCREELLRLVIISNVGVDTYCMSVHTSYLSIVTPYLLYLYPYLYPHVDQDQVKNRKKRFGWAPMMKGRRISIRDATGNAECAAMRESRVHDRRCYPCSGGFCFFFITKYGVP